MRLVRTTRADGVARLECRLPGGRISEVAAAELTAAAEELRLDEEASVVLLLTAGPDFCLGAECGAHGRDCIAALAQLPQPVIAAVQGRAWAEGCELALACDLRLASERASFRLPQIGEGRLPGCGGTQRLPRIVGAVRALEILWSGREVSAAEAEQIGLANRLTKPARCARAAAALAKELAAKGPISLRLAKEAVRAAGDLTLEQGIRFEQDLYVLLQTTADRAEGVRAFVERRRPRFKGR
jgi:enoyl-CoA hydratase/carnithine racemase